MKTCSSCNKTKEFTEFAKNKSTSDGYQRTCKVCRRKEQQAYYAKNKVKVGQQVKESKRSRRARYNEYKKTLSCVVCGEDFPPCLEFHHLDPNEKDFNISKMASNYSWENILEEINKCAILCNNCHTKVHHGIIEL